MITNGLDTEILQDKKILLYGPRFYGYCNIIKDYLEQMGASVKFCESFIFLEEWKNNRKLFDWVFRRIKNPFYKSRHTNQLIEEVGNEKYDIFLTISVYSSNKSFIDYLKTNNPNIKTIIYFWDAFSTWDFSDLIKYFDKSFTFDLEDSIRYSDIGLKHLPLFWTDAQISIPIDNSEHYDLVHIGSLHPKYTDRAKLCSEVATICKQNNRKYFFYLLSDVPKGGHNNLDFKQKLKFLFNREYRIYVKNIQSLSNYDDLIHSEPLSQEIVSNIENSTNCILDISLGRSGVAMRTIGALARNIKVITTNKSIRNERFYLPDKIFLIDRENPTINFQWIDDVSTTTMELDYLYIGNWIKALLIL